MVQERMRYTPLGWSKTYEISDAELRSGCDTIDQWLDIVAKGRANIAPEQIPWKDSFQVLFFQNDYPSCMKIA